VVKHGDIKRWCAICGWTTDWDAHKSHERQIEVGMVLVNPSKEAKETDVDHIRILAITVDDDELEVITFRKFYASPEREATAGHHRVGASTRHHFMRRYGTWS